MSLFEPVTFKSGATAKNRVALAPLTNEQSHADGTLGDDELAWLTRRARGGFGVVSTCAAHVSRDGQAFEGQLGVWSDAHVPRLRDLASAIAREGALGLVQLHHGGVRALSRLTGEPVWSASSFTEDRPGFEVPRAATVADLQRVMGDFGEAARRASEAGFSGVEVHGAHGYLLGQFLSATMNTRTDDFGGSIAGRALLLREVTRRVRDELPAPHVVGVRLSPEDFGQARGLDLDESLEVAAWLAEDGIDYCHLSLWDITRLTKKRPDQHAIALFRRALPEDVRIVVAGKIWTPAEAEHALSLGADLVALGRSAIVNPDWPRDAARPGWEPRRPPLTRAEYADVAVSATFASYLRRFDGMVGD
jgi:2,4-dienoyl-CoA reductase-like NADH-dependent reductase (Old Yellow Enzyme family)